jgi:hypothetical protein
MHIPAFACTLLHSRAHPCIRVHALARFFFFFFFASVRVPPFLRPQQRCALFLLLFFSCVRACVWIFSSFFARRSFPPLRRFVAQAHGFGTKTFKGGDKHVGTYVADVRQGFGTYYWSVALAPSLGTLKHNQTITITTCTIAVPARCSTFHSPFRPSFRRCLRPPCVGPRVDLALALCPSSLWPCLRRRRQQS